MLIETVKMHLAVNSISKIITVKGLERVGKRIHHRLYDRNWNKCLYEVHDSLASSSVIIIKERKMCILLLTVNNDCAMMK